ncbi:MAG: sodium:solute symporter family protein [Victivallaceae bacterium]|nr:sodium:solute symporter family protein [Victivallaceae bacterium]
MTGETAIMAGVLCLFIGLIGGLSYLGYRRTRSANDYMLAGREIHPFIMAMSYGAAFISTSAIVGFGGVAARDGMGILWLAFMNILFGIFIGFRFFGRRTRAIGQTLEAKTFPEFMGRRFGSTGITVFIAAVIFIFMPVYTSAVLMGGARVMEEVLNMPYNTALLVFAGVITVYVIFGGLRGMMYVDALLGTIMVGGMLSLLILTYCATGGVISTHQWLTDHAALVPEAFRAGGHQGWTAMPVFNSPRWWTLVSSLMFGVGVGALAQPQLAVRFMTVKGDHELNRAIWVGALFIMLTAGGAYVVGALSNVWFYHSYGKIAYDMVPNGNIDMIVPLFIHKALPDWFAYIFTITLLAAAMSTMSALLHVNGTSLGHDFFGNIGFAKFGSVVLTKVGILLAIIASVVLGAVLPGSYIARATAIFFGVCAASFLPAYTAGLYWRRATRAGVWASMTAGAAVSVFALLFMHRGESAPLGVCKAIFGRTELISSGVWPYIDSLVYSLPISIIVLVAVSLLTRADSEHADRCFAGISKEK